MPEICCSSVRVVGWACAMFLRTASPKTMKAGLPVLAASPLRHSRSCLSRTCWAGVSGREADLSASALRAFGRDDADVDEEWLRPDFLPRVFDCDLVSS